MIHKPKVKYLFTIIAVLAFTTQIGLQNIPISIVCHTEDGTRCTCGCRDIEVDQEELIKLVDPLL